MGFTSMAGLLARPRLYTASLGSAGGYMVVPPNESAKICERWANDRIAEPGVAPLLNLEHRIKPEYDLGSVE